MSGRGDKSKKQHFELKIQQEMNLIIRFELSDPRFSNVSITEVQLNKDYSQAVVLWDTFNSKNRGDVKKALDNSAKKIRTLLAQRLKVRHTPNITFKYNAQFVEEQKIDEILESEKEQGRFDPEGT